MNDKLKTIMELCVVQCMDEKVLKMINDNIEYEGGEKLDVKEQDIHEVLDYIHEHWNTL